MILPPKKICKKIRLVNNIGFCKIYDIPCRCFFCESLKQCRKEFRKCDYIEMDVVKIKKSIALKFVKKLKNDLMKSILYMLDELKEREAIFYLLLIREINLLSLFTAPGDFLVVPVINEILLKRNYKTKHFLIQEFDDNKYNWKSYTILSYFIATYTVFNEWNTIIKNNDGVLLYVRTRLGEIKKVLKSESFEFGASIVLTNMVISEENKKSIKESVKKVKRGDQYIFKKIKDFEYKNPSYFFSLNNNMEKPYIWAKRNNINPHNGFVNLKSNVKLLYNHICEVGEKNKINPIECYRIAQPFHLNLLYLLKNLMVRDKFYSKNKVFFASFYNIFQQKFDIILHQSSAEIFSNKIILYDNILYKIYEMEKDYIITSPRALETQTEDWQFILKNGVLMGTVLFFALFSMHYDDLFLNKKERGQYLEDFVEQLINSSYKAKLISRNVNYKIGEVDFIAKIDETNYLIEVKNYGPWHAREGEHVFYMGSADYERRLNKLQSYIDRIDKRLNYVKNHKKEFNIPENENITNGLIITYYKEFYLNIPSDFDLMSINEFEELLDYSPINSLNLDLKSRRKIELSSDLKEKAEKSKYIT